VLTKLRCFVPPGPHQSASLYCRSNVTGHLGPAVLNNDTSPAERSLLRQSLKREHCRWLRTMTKQYSRQGDHAPTTTLPRLTTSRTTSATDLGLILPTTEFADCSSDVSPLHAELPAERRGRRHADRPDGGFSFSPSRRNLRGPRRRNRRWCTPVLVQKRCFATRPSHDRSAHHQQMVQPSSGTLRPLPRGHRHRSH